MEIFLKELALAETPNYTIILIQGILMCLWYDLGTTLSYLEQTGNTEKFL